MPPVVTALRERPRGRVEVDLDGRSWRLVPADAVVRTGLVVGRALDRETARALGRELRRSKALSVALRALRYGEYSRSRLETRLEGRGASAAARQDALETLERAGLVDDARVAASRAQALAGRGFGDAAIRFSLSQEGLATEVVDEALAALEPEPDRARRLLDERGGTAKAVRWLAAKGFDAGTLEDVGGFADEA
jgi:SOS response regulatory protein OraA/RecX